MSEDPTEPWFVTWTIRLMGLVIGLSLIGGIAATVAGGTLTSLGEGFGGLYGVPSLLLTIAFLLAIPITIALIRKLKPADNWLRSTLVVAGGIAVVTFGYDFAGHLIDPCINEWWDLSSQAGGAPLCERFGSEISIHTRFHLLEHAAPAAILLWGYLIALRRWTPWATQPSLMH